MKKMMMIVSLTVTLAILVIAPLNQVSADNNEVIPKKDIFIIKTSSHGAGGW
ncbi:hypothetical protein NKT34_08805 [Paenibacillus polysaccharolyticus]|uniref:hypothetical protein n=1 Tax=Paenibacillus polysaccharolyticus TaxID=582692 RepID=UPI0020A149F5|nr:hypothetical protein [Paenibacillus polysaccharolyticus]MCP1133388.1 hypothetical protein [Paenibacillus polysaccharolyticus]